MSNIVFIQGSARPLGNTHRLLEYLRSKTGGDIIDLLDYRIGEFDYDFNNRDDDFLELIRHIIAQYDLIVFASPVYWYTMSGIMKTFFDRISDLLYIEKDTGRALRGKGMAVLSCSNGADIHSDFYTPFIRSAEYLGMEYVGGVHGWLDEDGTIPILAKNRLDDLSDVLINR